MASFTGVGDALALFVKSPGELVSIAISGTYAMDIRLQKELGSKGSGAWRDVDSATYKWSTANATVAATYTTKGIGENLRLYVVVDTSGTAVVTLTDGDKQLNQEVDDFGNVLSTQTQALKTFNSAVGFDGNTPVAVTTTPLAVTPAAHAFRTVTLDKADGITATLPSATGTGHVYRFYAASTVTSVGYIIKVTTTDVIQGGVDIATDIGGVILNTALTTDTITMNGSTTGGLIGSWVEVEDVAAGQWKLNGFLVSTGAEATPFSAGVS